MMAPGPICGTVTPRELVAAKATLRAVRKLSSGRAVGSTAIQRVAKKDRTLYGACENCQQMLTDVSRMSE